VISRRRPLSTGPRPALINVFDDEDDLVLRSLLPSYPRGFSDEKERWSWRIAWRCGLRAGDRTWTVVDASYATVGPVEEWLEAHRYLWSPNTVRGYATSLAQWWSFLEQRGESGRWTEAGVPAVSGFLSWLCNGRTVEHAVAAPAGVPSADTLHARLAALISFYQWQEASTRCRSRDGCCAGGLPGCRHGDCSRTWTRGVRVARHRWSRSAVTGGTGLRCCCRGRSRRSSTAAPPGMRRPGTGAGTCVTGCCSRCWPRAG
jgi:hypothetical protein